MPQDLPPSGGYEPVQYKRNLPARGFRPVYYLAAMGVIMTYGLYKAEEDRDQMRRYWADQAREKHLLGENLKVYHTDRWGLLPQY
ncbi:MAG: hypothetical protein OHK93_000257 [Ramalina farinacea]|uniref:NADH dehydrogenase [ubiquinone] 1 alpha subcomplex subunit 13 n=1 Tax=Ramalina farinacea TaxID=258253 RepID=A0AA43QG99_9LECA|nr:hypothetical protein [Ramalina farinacea]